MSLVLRVRVSRECIVALALYKRARAMSTFARAILVLRSLAKRLVARTRLNSAFALMHKVQLCANALPSSDQVVVNAVLAL